MCMEAPAAFAAVPCGHQSACGPCLERVRTSGDNRCPICRATISGIIKVIAAGIEDSTVAPTGACPACFTSSVLCYTCLSMSI